MKPFMYRILICVIPLLAAIGIDAWAMDRYSKGQGGFKLGVDLVGGTILVYEIDMDKFDGGKPPPDYSSEKLAEALKRRIDPADLYNIQIRALGSNRIEIVLPTGGAHQAAIEEANWQGFLEKLRGKWQPKAEGPDYDVGKGKIQELISVIKVHHPDANTDEIQAYIEQNYQKADKRMDVTGEEVQRIKDLISQVGKLDFRILANSRDDLEPVQVAQKFINDAKPGTPAYRDLERLAEQGKPPPPPRPTEGDSWQNAKGSLYSWVELGQQERRSLNLDNAAMFDDEIVSIPKAGRYIRSSYWHQIAEARDGVTFEWEVIEGGLRKVKRNADKSPVIAKKGTPNPALIGPMGDSLLYSREAKSLRMAEKMRQEKQFEYFILVRDPTPGKEIKGDYLTNVHAFTDPSTRGFAVSFALKSPGNQLFGEVTKENEPGKGPEENRFYRHLAIILDGYIVSAPRIQSVISDSGQITGNFTQKEAMKLENVLRSGALPATLKPIPVSENTVGPTLGSDTIKYGFWSVIWAFTAVIIFMVVYYRFAGLVASVALLANLLLTVAFMVVVSATFTLPGLAGLVLMLALAVDANVLIYERLREERERGASLALAIRNGYDRAFPTIIDTHLTSIFTAMVLYAVGNDQLKGFGISLLAGLVISLFTSLYMTRLIFDIWQSRNWLHKLSMLRLLAQPNLDFMRVRYYWFAATLILTVFGVSVFLLRGEGSLNIDFLSGSAYSGQLKQGEERTMTQLRDLFGEARQSALLRVESVKQRDVEGTEFEITYADPPSTLTIKLTEPAVSKNASAEDREKSVKQRAQVLPDWSVVQIFPSTESSEGGKSRFFKVRTSEKQTDLVQVTISRMLQEKKQDGQWVSLLKRIELEGTPKVEGRVVELQFNDYASPGYVKTLLDREFRSHGIPNPELFDLQGKGKSQESRYKIMTLEMSSLGAGDQAVDPTVINEVLSDFKKEFEARPPTESLENFDSAMAKDTQLRALYAILASWLAILLYLWFRFGNWTFGLAAVLCLVHDLLFTMGIIAFCHYIVVYLPWLGTVLGLDDFKIDLAAVAALLTLVGYSVNDTIVVFDRIREVRGKNPELTAQMINDSVNQTLSRTLLTSFITFLTVIVLYIFGGDGIHLFAFVMVVGVVVGTYSSIYIASPLLLLFGEGTRAGQARGRPQPQTESVSG